MPAAPQAEVYEAAGAELDSLIRDWNGAPYGGWKHLSPDERTQYLKRQMFDARSRGAAIYWVCRSGSAAAAAQWQPLPWDSGVLGIPAGRISWLIHRTAAGGDMAELDAVLQRCMKAAADQGIRYLVARVPAADPQGIQLLERAGFQMVDGILTFGMEPADVDSMEADASGPRCRPHAASDVEALERMAAESFRWDRFHSDPTIASEVADELHRRWVRNSCEGFADAVLVAETVDGIAGFTTLKLDADATRVFGRSIGTIVLVATAEAHRRRGVARVLTRSAVEWFRERGCSWVEVGTQIANAPAARLYQSAGFRLAAASLTFRHLS